MAAGEHSMEIKVGALILVSLALLVGFVFMLGDFRLKDQGYLYVDFPTSADLKEGAPVKVTGVTVGKVDSVDLWGGRRDPAHENKIVYVRVTLKVDSNVPAMLHDDAKFYITTLGALGEKYVEIDPGSPGRPTLKDGDLAEGLGPLRLEHLGADAGTILNQLSGILMENRANVREFIANMKDISARVDEMLVENREPLKEAIAGARDTLERLARVASAIEVAAGDGRDLRDLVRTARSLADELETQVGPALERFPRIVAKIEHAIDGIDGLVGDGRELVAEGGASVKAALENARDITRKVKDGKGSIGALVSDRELYDDIIEMIKDVKRRPWKLLWKE